MSIQETYFSFSISFRHFRRSMWLIIVAAIAAMIIMELTSIPSNSDMTNDQLIANWTEKV